MNKALFEVCVFNVPDDLSNYRYVIARYADGELWYYGADNNYDRSNEVATNIGNGIVLNNPFYNN